MQVLFLLSLLVESAQAEGGLLHFNIQLVLVFFSFVVVFEL
jgi:hypothetical protein